MNAIDKAIGFLSPSRGLSRAKARLALQFLARHFDAAAAGYRTDNWPRRYTDANAANGPALSVLRAHARDLQRNNAWAQNGLRAIGRNTVGWGIIPSANTKSESTKSVVADLWRRWAVESTQCDSDGRSTFYGIQRQIIETVARDGEVLVRLRQRRPEDELAIPLQLQVLESDFLDASKDGAAPNGLGGKIVQGVEFDVLGRRVAYWLFEEHPGATTRFGSKFVSKRVSAENVVHIFRQERPGQVRGVSWLAAAIVALKDFDEFEGATIVRQKIAALFAVFVTDPDGGSTPLGTLDTAATATAPAIETLEPGMIKTLPPGKSVSFSSPPTVVNDEFTKRTLQKVAAGTGVTYEDLTGDFSEVNFSSARMARLAHWSNVHDWRWNMLVPQFCDVAWARAMRTASIAGLIGAEIPTATWTPPSMPMIEPDKEGLAYMRLVRAGAMTPDEMVREQGHDPATHWKAYAACMENLDALGIVIDSDARKTTQAGLSQQINAAKGATAAQAAGGSDDEKSEETEPEEAEPEKSEGEKTQKKTKKSTAGDTDESRQIFGYHLQFGVAKLGDARKALGLPADAKTDGMTVPEYLKSLADTGTKAAEQE